jgi:hypothetical protein
MPIARCLTTRRRCAARKGVSEDAAARAGVGCGALSGGSRGTTPETHEKYSSGRCASPSVHRPAIDQTPEALPSSRRHSSRKWPGRATDLPRSSPAGRRILFHTNQAGKSQLRTTYSGWPHPRRSQNPALFENGARIGSTTRRLTLPIGGVLGNIPGSSVTRILGE